MRIPFTQCLQCILRAIPDFFAFLQIYCVPQLVARYADFFSNMGGKCKLVFIY